MRKLIVIICTFFLVGCGAEEQYYIVEKGEYSRVQYIVEQRVMRPEFTEGYYIIMRNGHTGKEEKIKVSKDIYDVCVVGDIIDNVRK